MTHVGPGTLALANVWFDSALALDPRFGRAALLRADRYMHHALDGRGRMSELPGMSVEAALIELRRSLDVAVQNAPDDYSRLMIDVERELFAPSWHRLPGLARQLATLGGLEDQDVETVWAPNFLAVTGHTDLARAVSARALATEFDLADTPNFSARLREAGVDPASFRRMPRLSEHRE